MSSITLAASAAAGDDTYNNAIVALTGGTGAGQSAIITDYVGISKVATVNRTWAIPGTQGREAVAATALFRGVGTASAIDYNDPVGLALGKSTAVANFARRGHAPSTWYVYATRAVNGAGVLSPLEHHPVRLLTDGAGDIINPPVPNPPARISARALAGGKVEVVIWYARQGQAVAPTDLRVYGKAVSDPHQPDAPGLYTTPLVDAVTGLSAMACRAQVARYVFNDAGSYVPNDPNNRTCVPLPSELLPDNATPCGAPVWHTGQECGGG